MYFRRSGWPVAEVPVRWSHQAGSKVRPFDYIRVLAELVTLRARAVPKGHLLVAALFLVLSVALYSAAGRRPRTATSPTPSRTRTSGSGSSR